jgi:hypothetical protein
MASRLEALTRELERRLRRTLRTAIDVRISLEQYAKDLEDAIFRKEALVCLLIGFFVWMVEPGSLVRIKSAHGMAGLLAENILGGIIGGFLFCLIFLIFCKLIAMGFRYVVRRFRRTAKE